MAPGSTSPAVVPAAPVVLPSPEEAWKALQQDAGDPAKRTTTLVYDRSKAYLEAFAAERRTAKGADFLYLAQMLQAARRTDEAVAMFEQGADAADAPEAARLSSAVQWSQLVRGQARNGRMAKEAAEAGLKKLTAWAPMAKGTTRAVLLATQAHFETMLGRHDDAVATWVAAAEANPEASAQAADAASDVLLELAGNGLEGAAAARAKHAKVLAALTATQARALANAQEALAKATDDAQRKSASQRVQRMEQMTRVVSGSGRALEMLGAPAPEWTLVKAYGKGQSLADYRGKVVVLDFWATWCPWCIRSFPAVRDLLRDYAGQDLVVVGVTATGANLYDQRYDLDDDMKTKAGAGPVKPVLQRPRPPAALAADAGEEAKAKHLLAVTEYERALAAFPAQEQEIIARFIENHAMTWDTVQIDDKEPGPKYALGGWPHCVVIDREGRVRHFKSGALLRDQPEGVAKLRKVLDLLLAEPAAAAAPATK